MTRGHYSHLDAYNTGINEVTGDSLRTKPATDLFRENFERIFGVAKSSPDHLRKQNDRITDGSKGCANVRGDAPEANPCDAGSSR